MLLLLCASTKKLETTVHLSCLLTSSACCVAEHLPMFTHSMEWSVCVCVCAGQAGRESHRRGDSSVC